MDTVDRDDSFLARDSPEYPHALIAYDSTHRARTPAVAHSVAGSLEHAGFIVDIADAATNAMPPPPDYELVVIGMAPTRHGDRALSQWIGHYAAELGEMPSALFIVAPPRHQTHALRRCLRAFAWQPVVAVMVSPSAPDGGGRVLDELAAKLAALVRDAALSIALASQPIR